MSDNPRGVYRTIEEGGSSKVAIETGAILLFIPEQEYRANGYDPPFDDLPLTQEPHAPRKSEMTGEQARP